MFAAPRDPPARIGVSIATCDNPEALRPDCHIWVGAKAPWLEIDGGIPHFDAGWSQR